MFNNIDSSGLCYNPIMIINDNARVINKLETHLLTPLESSFTIVKCLLYRPQVSVFKTLFSLIVSAVNKLKGLYLSLFIPFLP